MTHLKPGAKVSGNIRLVRPLGQGAMGAVWVADHLTLDTQVAVKFINKAFGEDPEIAARFTREAKAAAKIKSPHVVQIFDHGFMDDGTAFIVMELLEGESLGTRLERTGWLAISQSAEIVSQVAKALARAHAQNVVHRDIKPENIFLCKADEGLFIKLLDFGIAKDSGIGHQKGMTQPGVMVGTAEYMSREQVLSSRDVDYRCDLWALAVVAYEMLTGDVPFRGETLGQICVAICNGEYTAASKLRKDVDPAVDAFFEQAFARNLDARFSSARELASALRQALLGEGGDRPSVETPIPRIVRGTDVGLGQRRVRITNPQGSDRGPASVQPEDDDDFTDGATQHATPSLLSRVPAVVEDDLGLPVAPEPASAGDVSQESARDERSPSLPGAASPIPMRPRRGLGALLVAAGILVVAGGALLIRRQGQPPPEVAASTAVERPAPPPAAPPASEPAPEPTAEPAAPSAETVVRAPASSKPRIASSSAASASIPAQEPSHVNHTKRPDYGF